MFNNVINQLKGFDLLCANTIDIINGKATQSACIERSSRLHMFVRNQEYKATQSDCVSFSVMFWLVTLTIGNIIAMEATQSACIERSSR